MKPSRQSARRNPGVAIALVLFLSALPGAIAFADETPRDVKVEQRSVQDNDLNSLRFLRANRDFLRTRLDRLLQRPDPAGRGEADLLDNRHLLLRSIMAEIDAARDSVRSENIALERRELLDSIDHLAKLDSQLTLMDRLLDDQEGRLRVIDEDLRGNQNTALIILLKGLPPDFEPEAIHIDESGGPSLRVSLAVETRAALRRGGIAQIYHEYVEPREHELRIGLGGRGEISFLVDTPLDQLSFLQLDLAHVVDSGDLNGIRARVWQD